jgi:ribonuclease H / adenosylcobalamin/alpha-ribazole phosphatase
VRAILRTDGGARGNPGPAGIGVVLEDGSGTVVAEIGRGIGHATNNVAEYEALIAGLEIALDQGVTEVEVYLDSELVAQQVAGRWKIKNETLRGLAVRAGALLERFESARITQVPRERNVAADALANQGMDASELDLVQERELPEQPTLSE